MSKPSDTKPCPAIKSVTMLILTPNMNRTKHAIICAASFTRGFKSIRSSIRPITNIKALASNTPSVAEFSFKKGNAPIKLPRNSATPPTLGMGDLCILRLFGRSTRPSFIAAFRTKGTSSIPESHAIIKGNIICFIRAAL
ncbi:MAG: hypothetical protein BWY02_02995 [bacterium ADurb.Bin157]|nr:MAG: hypothetical protein BWY02_02995 [bacterium ADurb.Bin157]